MSRSKDIVIARKVASILESNRPPVRAFEPLDESTSALAESLDEIGTVLTAVDSMQTSADRAMESLKALPPGIRSGRISHENKRVARMAASLGQTVRACESACKSVLGINVASMKRRHGDLKDALGVKNESIDEANNDALMYVKTGLSKVGKVLDKDAAVSDDARAHYKTLAKDIYDVLDQVKKTGSVPKDDAMYVKTGFSKLSKKLSGADSDVAAATHAAVNDLAKDFYAYYDSLGSKKESVNEDVNTVTERLHNGMDDLEKLARDNDLPKAARETIMSVTRDYHQFMLHLSQGDMPRGLSRGGGRRR